VPTAGPRGPTGCPIVVPYIGTGTGTGTGVCGGGLEEDLAEEVLVTAVAADWPVMGDERSAEDVTLVMSWMLDRRRSLFIELRRMKYFCA
jgi:hypothetical protein